jgi:hypothetical protein
LPDVESILIHDTISAYDPSMSRCFCTLAIALMLLVSSAATAAPPCACPGDCNGDGQVTINELVGLVSLQLGDLDGVCGCEMFCTTSDACANIDILVVQTQFNLLNGCPSHVL